MYHSNMNYKTNKTTLHTLMTIKMCNTHLTKWGHNFNNTYKVTYFLHHRFSNQIQTNITLPKFNIIFINK